MRASRGCTPGIGTTSTSGRGQCAGGKQDEPTIVARGGKLSQALPHPIYDPKVSWCQPWYQDRERKLHLKSSLEGISVNGSVAFR